MEYPEFDKRTVNALAIPLLLPVKHGVLVSGQHLLLRGHLCVPPFQLLQSLALLRQRRIHRRDDIVDGPKALSLSVFLGL